MRRKREKREKEGVMEKEWEGEKIKEWNGEY